MDAHRAWCVLRERDHAGIAPIVGASRRAVPVLFADACDTDELPVVGENKMTGLDTGGSVGPGSSGSLHLWLR